ncbi:MAG: sporulation protein YqfD [Clostridiaceae bacterium]
MDYINRMKKGRVTLKIRSYIPEKFINLLWSRGIYASNIRLVDLTTVIVDIDFQDLRYVQELADESGAKYQVIDKKGLPFFIMKGKKEISLFMGFVLFFSVIQYLSTYIWSIEINTKKYIAPFEVRRQLEKLGIKPGIKKSAVDVYSLEKKLEDANSEIMWVNVRIQGSNLKVVIEEKTNPPKIKDTNINGGIIAKQDGVVERIYTISGTPEVKVGDIVKKGDLLIAPKQGQEGVQYDVKAEGRVLADTFYEKSIEVQVSGRIKERTGNKQESAYFNFWGKKIYIKKSVKTYDDYDKIEFKGNFINNEIYYEIKEKEIYVDRDLAVKNTVDKARESVLKEIDKDTKIDKEIIDVYEGDPGKIIIKVVFVVKQDIAAIYNQGEIF